MNKLASLFVTLTLLFGCEFIGYESTPRHLWDIHYGVSRKNTPYCIEPNITRGFNNNPRLRECVWLHVIGKHGILGHLTVTFRKEPYRKWRYNVDFDEKNQ